MDNIKFAESLIIKSKYTKFASTKIYNKQNHFLLKLMTIALLQHTLFSKQSKVIPDYINSRNATAPAADYTATLLAQFCNSRASDLVEALKVLFIQSVSTDSTAAAAQKTVSNEKATTDEDTTFTTRDEKQTENYKDHKNKDSESLKLFLEISLLIDAGIGLPFFSNHQRKEIFDITIWKLDALKANSGWQSFHSLVTSFIQRRVLII